MKWTRQVTILLFTIVTSIYIISCSSSMTDSANQKESRSEDDFSGESFVAQTPKLKQEEGEDETHLIEKAKKLATSDKFRVHSPEMLSRYKSSEKEPLPFVSHDISVVVAGHYVRVVQDMVFENPTSGELSGNLLVELPDGASPSYLGMFQGNGKAVNTTQTLDLFTPQLPDIETLLQKEITLPATWGGTNWGELRSARVVNPVQGRQVYENITRRRVDPALAEWAGSGKFSTRIFPIPPGYKRVVFCYDQPLKTIGNTLLYALPLPKKIQAQTRVTTHVVPNYFANSQLIAGDRELMATKNSWEFSPEKNFIGSLILKAQPLNPELQILVGEDNQVPGKLAHIRYQPKLPEVFNLNTTGKALFIVDTSYSGKDKLYNLSGKMLRAVLEEDTSITEFAILGFDVRCRWISPFVSNTVENREKSLASVEKIWLEGATNFSSVLKFLEILNMESTETIFFLSDGQITWGEEKPKEFIYRYPNIAQKRWICYSFGDAPVNRNLLQALTRYGQIVDIPLGQDLKQAAMAHRKQLSTLDQLTLDGTSEITISGNPKYIYPGQTLEIAARVLEDATSINMHCHINGNKQTVNIPLAVSPQTSFIACRAWANLYAQLILNLYDEEADELALALSQRFALTNRQASFIILETDAEYQEHQIVAKKLNIEELTKISLQKLVGRPIGAPKLDGLPKNILEFLFTLDTTKANVWNISHSVNISNENYDRLLFQRENKNNHIYLYDIATKIFSQNKAQALRVLSTIVELNPQDDPSLRIVGYVLMEWGMYEEALELFARVRQRRPFEPQNYLMEGMALAAQGKLYEAAIRYELLLNESFSRFDEFTKPTAMNVYRDLLLAVAQQNPKLADSCYRRMTSFPNQQPTGKLLLFWNIDNTDVDLHVVEKQGVEVNYQNTTSSTGGKLFWDNTAGLGPEMYHHPNLSQEGFQVYVNYFGSSDVEGRTPAATLVTAFTKRGERYDVRWHTTVLKGRGRDGKVFIMPRWKR